jgi:hypothetical protein
MRGECTVTEDTDNLAFPGQRTLHSGLKAQTDLAQMLGPEEAPRPKGSFEQRLDCENTYDLCQRQGMSYFYILISFIYFSTPGMEARPPAPSHFV